jgi:NADPH-dependent 7-cyano-7-deazaguanine reductase QueF
MNTLNSVSKKSGAKQKTDRTIEQYPDIASFYIYYMERHWIIEKKPLEISFRYDSARK